MATSHRPGGGTLIAEVTPEAFAAMEERLAAVEKQLAALTATKPPRKKDWRRVVGMFDAEPEFMQQVIAEGQAIREAAREGTEQ